MQTLLPTLTPSWKGRLVSTTDERAARRLNRRVSIKSIVQEHSALYREIHEGRYASIVIYCSGELYELEAA